MSETDKALEAVRHYSTVVGIPICTLLLIPLIIQCRKRNRLSQQQNTTDSDTKWTKKLKQFVLLILAFGCVIFAILYFVMWLIISSRATLSNANCFWLIWTFYLCFTASFHFFCLFMLYRTKIVFTRPVSMQMSKVTLYSLLIAIHCITLYKISLFVHYEFVWMESFGECVPLLRAYMDLDTLLTKFYIRYWLDSVLIFALFVLFLRKLWMLRHQDAAINAFFRRTLIYAIIACLCTLSITVGRLLGIATHDFLPIDTVINCVSIVFSFKMDCSCMDCNGDVRVALSFQPRQTELANTTRTTPNNGGHTAACTNSPSANSPTPAPSVEGAHDTQQP